MERTTFITMDEKNFFIKETVNILSIKIIQENQYNEIEINKVIEELNRKKQYWQDLILPCGRIFVNKKIKKRNKMYKIEIDTIDNAIENLNNTSPYLKSSKIKSIINDYKLLNLEPIEHPKYELFVFFEQGKEKKEKDVITKKFNSKSEALEFVKRNFGDIEIIQ